MTVDVRRSALRAAERRAKTLANPDAHPLAKARARRDLTQRELSELTRVDKNVISGIETGRYRYRLNPTTRAAIAAALATDESELFPQ